MKNFQFLEVKFSIYLNRRVFLMLWITVNQLMELNARFDIKKKKKMVFSEKIDVIPS